MTLSIFDLDDTLIAGDSDRLWGEFLSERPSAAPGLRATHERFHRQYQEGALDIRAFLRFQLGSLAKQPPDRLARWRAEYLERKIRPIVLKAALQLVEGHRRQGHTLLIVTATNRFLTEPIAGLFGIEHLIASEAEMRDGLYTGEVAGTPAFAEGKVARLHDWLSARGETLEGSWAYSDSHNDLPLLRQVRHPVAVDPDPLLQAEAQRRNWRIVSLRDSAAERPP